MAPHKKVHPTMTWQPLDWFSGAENGLKFPLSLKLGLETPITSKLWANFVVFKRGHPSVTHGNDDLQPPDGPQGRNQSATRESAPKATRNNPVDHGWSWCFCVGPVCHRKPLLLPLSINWCAGVAENKLPPPPPPNRSGKEKCWVGQAAV